MAQDVAVIKVNPPSRFVGPIADRSNKEAFWVKSNVVAFSDTTAINLVEMPGNCLVVSAWIHVLTAFDASGTSARCSATISVPVGSGPEIIWDADASDLQTTGFYPSTGVMCLVPSSGGYIVMDYTPNTTTAGTLEAYFEVVPFADEL